MPLLFFGGAAGGFLRAQPGKIIPVPVVFGGMASQKYQRSGLLRRFWRGPIADLAATLAVAQAHLGRRRPLSP